MIHYIKKLKNKKQIIKIGKLKSLKYDSSLNKSNTHNIYGALIEKSVVCEGYAKSFK